jgi:thioredoxin 1
MIDDENFKAELRKAKLPVLMVFSASFCGPSQSIGGMLDQFFDAFEGRVNLAEISVETCPKMTREFQVKGTPSFIVVNQGEPISSRIGTMSYKQLSEWVEASISFST